MATGIGFDVRSNAAMKFGLDATWERLFPTGTSRETTALTIGTDAVFGHW